MKLCFGVIWTPRRPRTLAHRCQERNEEQPRQPAALEVSFLGQERGESAVAEQEFVMNFCSTVLIHCFLRGVFAVGNNIVWLAFSSAPAVPIHHIIGKFRAYLAFKAPRRPSLPFLPSFSKVDRYCIIPPLFFAYPTLAVTGPRVEGSPIDPCHQVIPAGRPAS